MTSFMVTCNARTEFEEITKSYNMPRGSSIDIIEWFIENGHRSNSFRNGFSKARDLAEQIKDYYHGSTETLAGEFEV